MKRGKWKATKFTLINFPAIYFHLAREINRDLPYVSFIFPFFPICSHDFLMIFLDVPIFSYGFPMIFLYVPIFSHGFPWFSPGFPMMGSLTAQDLPKGGQCGRRPAGHTIREADFNPSLWWYHGNGNNKLAGRKPSYLAGENRAGKFQTNQPRQGLTLVMPDLHVPLAGTYLQQHFLRNVWWTNETSFLNFFAKCGKEWQQFQ